MTLAFVSFKDFKYFQIDVKSACLSSFIEVEVYVERSPGFVDPTQPSFVFKHEKALYDLNKLRVSRPAAQNTLKRRHDESQ